MKTPRNPSPRDLESLLRGPKPGLAAQLDMAPMPPPGTMTFEEAEGSSLKAAVLILLYPRDGASHIVFIRRPPTSLHHKDQIAFPGGQIENGEDRVRAALRETHEEIGVPSAEIRVLGEITPLFIPPSNFCVYPVVGVAERPLRFIPFAQEVAEILEVPLALLLDPDHVRRETWKLERGPVLVPFYEFGRHKIWGATAMILSEFLALVR